MFNTAKSYYNQLNKYEALGRKPKDVIAVAESRHMAEEIKQNVIDQLDFFSTIFFTNLTIRKFSLVMYILSNQLILYDLKVFLCYCKQAIYVSFVAGRILTMASDSLWAQYPFHEIA